MPEAAAMTNSGRTTRKIPRIRRAETTRFTVDDQKGYLTTADAEDGSVGEVTIRMAKQGSTLAGMMDALGAAITLGLQAGAPAEVYVSKYSSMRFAPHGPHGRSRAADGDVDHGLCRKARGPGLPAPGTSGGDGHPYGG